MEESTSAALTQWAAARVIALRGTAPISATSASVVVAHVRKINRAHCTAAAACAASYTIGDQVALRTVIALEDIVDAGASK